MKKIKIYSTPSCVYCKKAKDYFTTLNLSFQEYNVAEDEGAYEEMVSKSGQMNVPVIDIEGQIVVGFNPSEVGKLLSL